VWKNIVRHFYVFWASKKGVPQFKKNHYTNLVTSADEI